MGDIILFKWDNCQSSVSISAYKNLSIERYQLKAIRTSQKVSQSQFVYVNSGIPI